MIRLGLAVGMVLAGVALGWALMGCGGGTPTPEQQAAVMADYAEQLRCVEAYATRDEIERCRAAVQAKRP